MMMRLCLALALVVGALAAEVTVKPETTMPADVPAAVKALLKAEGQSVFEDGKKVMSLFYVASVPKGSNDELNVTHKNMAHGTLLGVAHFPDDYVDRRGNPVKAGTYNVRLSFFPVNGAHQGIEPQRDFLILTKPSIDKDPKAMPSYGDLMDMAIDSSDVNHPMALSCWNNDYDQANGLVKEGDDSHPEWVLYTNIGDKKMAIIVVGVHTEG